MQGNTLTASVLRTALFWEINIFSREASMNAGDVDCRLPAKLLTPPLWTIGMHWPHGQAKDPVSAPAPMASHADCRVAASALQELPQGWVLMEAAAA